MSVVGVRATDLRRAVVMLCLGLFSMATPALAGGRYYNHSGSIETNHPDWMSWVPNGTSVAALSVPGTHDTMAMYGGDLAQTQSLGLRAQLDAGIRALDIRCRHIGDRFAIHHGIVYQHANFDDVLTVATQFLREHPTETLLMRVKEEHTAEGNTRSFNQTFEWYRNQPAYSPYIWRGAYVPSLAEVRGKIVILDNFSGGSYGVSWGSIDLQDDYDVPTIFDIDDKWDKVRNHLSKTNTGSPSTLYVNFTSGTSTGAYPYTVAGGDGAFNRGVNDYAVDHLVGANVQRAGVIMMDFPGAGLIDSILALNYRLGSSSAGLPGDFSTIFRNISYSIGGDAEARWYKVRDFVNNAAPGRYWHTVIMKSNWGAWIALDGAFAQSDSMDNYTHLVFTSRTVTSAVSNSYLASFVNAQLGSLSGGAGDRAVQLQERVSARFPFQNWAALVKQSPGGFSNWAYSNYGTAYQVSQSDYTYAVIGYAAGDGVYAYEHGNYEGNVLRLTSNVAQLGSDFDDRISSIRVIGPYLGTFCEHPNQTGRCFTTDQDLGFLGDLKGGPWNDVITSAGASVTDFRWSQAGATGGYCTLVNEPSSPSWSDNYLCSRSYYGIQFSYAGPIAGMRCTQITEPSAVAYGWADNYLCVPQNSPLQLSWSYAGPIAGKRCTRVFEDADPNGWYDNYLCY